MKNWLRPERATLHSTKFAEAGLSARSNAPSAADFSIQPVNGLPTEANVFSNTERTEYTDRACAVGLCVDGGNKRSYFLNLICKFNLRQTLPPAPLYKEPKP